MAKKQDTPEVVAQTVMLPLSKIETNHGQIEGLPKNPRVLRDAQFERLKKSILDNPEMLTLRELLVYPHDGKYVVIGGNMRLRVLQDLGEKTVPCKIIPEDTSVDNLRAYTIKDNTSGGEWDWDDLANGWDEEELEAFGLDLPDGWGEEEEEQDREGLEGDDRQKGREIPEVEAMLDEAMRRNAREFLEQLDYDMQKGWLPRGVTQGYVEAQFIKAKFYGGQYKAINNLYFQPNRFLCPSGVKNKSLRTAFAGVAGGKKCGLAGLRKATNDGNLAAPNPNYRHQG